MGVGCCFEGPGGRLSTCTGAAWAAGACQGALQNGLLETLDVE